MNRRRRERVATDIPLTCRVPATPSKARILDLSHNGCRLALKGVRPETGATISMDIGTGETMTGEVVWTAREEIGVRFHRTLRPHIAVHWGIEEPRPIEVRIAEAAPATGLLSHWFRRLGKLFS